MPPKTISEYFNPFGSGYDMNTALASGLKRDINNHMGSLDPRTGMVLKGRGHESWNPMVQEEMSLGNTVEYNPEKNRYFSIERGMNEGSVQDKTKVHNNIDDLILQAELDRFAQTGSIRADTSPEYIGGVDPVVENIAMGPLLTLKSLGSVGREIIKKTGLRNPVSHFTRGESAKNILESGTIKGASESFPGKPFYKDSRKYLDKQLNRDKSGWLSETDIKFQEQFPKSPAVSVTRDPMFLERPHKHVGTDIRFVMDRDELIKKGLKISPYVELSGMPGYSKTLNNYGRGPITLDNYKKIHGYYPDQMNPMFEFEERVRGYIPTESVKLIDLIGFSRNNFLTDINNQDLIKSLVKSNIPKIKSETAYRELLDLNKRLTSKNWEDKVSKTGGVLHLADTRGNLLKYIDELINTPTYKNSLFKP
mgnify:CR=1 FL=1